MAGQFIDFALLAPGVKIGDTPGHTDVIMTRDQVSFAGRISITTYRVDARIIFPPPRVCRIHSSQKRCVNSRVTAVTHGNWGAWWHSQCITRAAQMIFHGSPTILSHDNWTQAVFCLFRSVDCACRETDVGGCKSQQTAANQFGFTAGGPLIKEQNFLLRHYEGSRRPRVSITIRSSCTISPDQISSRPHWFPLENLNVHHPQIMTIHGTAGHASMTTNLSFATFNNGSLPEYRH